MPRRTVLSKSQKQRFEKLPTTAEELASFFTLTKEEIEFIKNRRRQHNKIGFAVQLSLMKYPGRTLKPNESIPSEILNFISEQIDVDSDEFKYYGRREETIREHASQISKWLGYEATHLHHGDCVGADTSFHEIGEELNLSISIHPPDKKGLRSFCKPKGEGISHEEKQFIKRNHDIVNACDVLIACPETSKEVQRSGTWATIRYARKHGKEVKLIPSKE